MPASRLALIGALLSLSACAPSETDEAPAQRLPAAHSYEQLVRGGAFSCNGAQSSLIRNEADWQAFWTAVDPDEPLPAVDFATSSVLASCVALPNPGYRQAITGWEESAPGQLTVHTTVAAPACGVYTQQVVAGYHAIRIDGVFDVAEFQQGSAVRESCELPHAQFGWETLAYGYQSGCLAATDTVIRTPEDWAAFWSQLHSHVSPEPERPAVDFAAESVVAHCLGERPDGGYASYFTYVHEPDGSGHIVLDGTEYVAGPTCPVTLATTQPYHVIRVNRVVTGATVRRLTFEDACD